MKLNNSDIEFNVSNEYANKGWWIGPNTTLAPNDITNQNGEFDLIKLQNNLGPDDIDYIKVLHSLLIDWDGANLSELGSEFSEIKHTGQLMKAIIKASKMGGTVDSYLSSTSNNAIKNKVVTKEFSDLEAAISNLAYVAAENMSNLD